MLVASAEVVALGQGILYTDHRAGRGFVMTHAQPGLSFLARPGLHVALVFNYPRSNLRIQVGQLPRSIWNSIASLDSNVAAAMWLVRDRHQDFFLAKMLLPLIESGSAPLRQLILGEAGGTSRGTLPAPGGPPESHDIIPSVVSIIGMTELTAHIIGVLESPRNILVEAKFSAIPRGSP
jgi:hypothetical protein